MSRAEYPGAIDMIITDPAWVFTDAQPSFAIVIHKTAGMHSATDVANMFAHDTVGHTSSHFVIGQDGTIVQCVLLKDGAGANGIVEPGYSYIWNQFIIAGINLNTITISIEHVDPALDNSTSLTASQKLASFSLVKWLMHTKNIPVSRVLGHFTIAPESRKLCPNNYPWQELYNFTGAYMVPKGWSDDGKVLTAPNGIQVLDGFREHILDNNWNPDDWPLMPAAASSNLEKSNPSVGAGTYQLFRKSLLEYTTERGTFEGWIGQELAYIESQIKKLV